jgi:hypothetical protein
VKRRKAQERLLRMTSQDDNEDLSILMKRELSGRVPSVTLGETFDYLGMTAI